jgi:hypothetical protein
MAVPLYDSTTQYDATLVGYDGLGDGVTTMPTLGVFIAFDGSPYDVEPVWTEVTPYVTNVDIDRGRSDDFSPFVSTAYVTFQNNTRQFDPFNTAGAYYGKLIPRKQIKIVAMNNGILYPVFRGFVEGFPVQFTEAGYASTVSVQCFDLLALLATAQLPDPISAYTNSLSPVHYWRCNDPLGNNIITDSISGKNVAPSNGFTRFTTQPSMSDALAFDSTGVDIGDSSANPVVGTTGDITLVGWVTNNTGAAGIPYASGWLFSSTTTTGSLLNLFQIAFQSSQLTVTVSSSTGGTPATCETPNKIYPVGAAVHVAATYTKSTGLCRLYVNGVDLTTLQVARSGLNFFPLSNTIFAQAFFQEVAVFDRILSATEIENIYNYSKGSLIQTSAQRFQNIIATTSVNSARTIVTSTPVATVSELDKEGTLVVESLHKTTDSEYGFMYCNKEGKIVFADRNSIYSDTRSNTSQATFGTGGIPFEPQIDMQLSGDQIRNEIIVTFSGEGKTKQTNTVSTAAYGTNAETVDTQLSTIAQAKTLATYVSTVAGNLTTNLSPLRIGVTKTTADYATMLGLELLDRTTVVVTPKTGSSFTKIQLLNKITHSITPSSWDITVDGSEQYTAWFILNSSTLDDGFRLQ